MTRRLTLCAVAGLMLATFALAVYVLIFTRPMG
jgi:hypothetical protein